MNKNGLDPMGIIISDSIQWVLLLVIIFMIATIKM